MIARAKKVALRQEKNFFNNTLRVRTRVIVWFLGEKRPAPLCSCIIAKKHAPHAVDRNNIKRKVYDELAQSWETLPRRSIVALITKKDIEESEVADAIAELCNLAHSRVPKAPTTA